MREPGSASSAVSNRVNMELENAVAGVLLDAAGVEAESDGTVSFDASVGEGAANKVVAAAKSDDGVVGPAEAARIQDLMDTVKLDRSAHSVFRNALDEPWLAGMGVAASHPDRAAVKNRARLEVLES